MVMRWIKLTVLALMLLLPIALVSGQTLDKRALLCGDLGEADCQILLQNDAVMDGVNAFAFDASMTLDVEAPEPEAMSLVIDASGAMSFSQETMSAILAMEDSLMNPGMLAAAEETFAMFDALIAGMSAQLTAAVQVASQDGTEDMSLNLRIKDGIVVLNAAAVAAATGESMGSLEWFGVDATGLFSLLAADPDMQSAMASEMDMSGASEMMMAQAVTRLADSEVNGVPVAVFEMEQNLDQFMGLLDTEATAAVAESSSTLTATMRHYVGLEDHYTYRAEFIMNSADEALTASMDMSMTMDFSEFNLPVAVEIPEDAFVFPLEFLLQMGE